MKTTSPRSCRPPPWLGRLSLVLLAAALPAFAVDAASHATGLPAGTTGEKRWFKGNLHTHSLWSDGDDYPEMVADWYKREGYHFLALSDHNVLQEGSRWLPLDIPDAERPERSRDGSAALEPYLRRFGPAWVELRGPDGRREVRLKPLAEYRSLLEEPGRFLLIAAEEISARWQRPATATAPEAGGPVHLNVTNPRELIAPGEGASALEVMQQAADAVQAQRERTGQAMLLHLNHPNHKWAITAEELMLVRHERFFEVYNGHPRVRNGGDATHLTTDAMWDAILTRRLAELHLPPMFGLAVDDAHHYQITALGQANAGRGWVMVRAPHLTAESLIAALEAGDFYASTGVILTDVRRSGTELAVEIQAEPGVTYVTRFIGTRRGYDPASQVLPPAPADAGTLPHRRYSRDVGAVLAEVAGPRASYPLRGDELYVRAKIISSKPKPNASVADEVECAWTQPLVRGAP